VHLTYYGTRSTSSGVLWCGSGWRPYVTAQAQRGCLRWPHARRSHRPRPHLQEEGKITPKQAGIDPVRLKLLRKVFDSHDLTEGLKPIYDLLEGAYSYDELHLYLAAYRSIQTKLKKSK